MTGAGRTPLRPIDATPDDRATHPAVQDAGGPAMEVARRRHSDGVYASTVGRPANAVRHLTVGLRALGWQVSAESGATPPTDPDPARDGLAARLLISLAHAESECGRGTRGFKLLSTARHTLRAEDEGIWLQQRGLLLFRSGYLTEALECFDRAEPIVIAAGQRRPLMRGTLNRSSVHLQTGRVAIARSEANRAAALASELGEDATLAMAIHNAAYCDQLTGDLPAAMAGFARVERLYRDASPSQLPMLATDRADALLTAGLAKEAGELAEEAATQFDRLRRRRHQAEAELRRAQAALAARAPEVAADWAARAERRFHATGNARWAALAALTRLRAELAECDIPRSPSRFAARARRLSARLGADGLPGDAETAELLAARAWLRAGRYRRAVDALPAPTRNATLDTVLLRRLVRAEVAAAGGRRTTALTGLRRGLDALHARRETLGSPDLQAAVAGLGRELASTGLNLAIDSGRPRSVFAWTERVRAQAFRVPSVRPPADPEVADALGELRQVRHLMRSAELAGRTEPGAVERCGELEARLIEAGWQVPGPGVSRAEVDLDQVNRALADTGGLMLSFLVDAGRLHALVVEADRVRLVALGDRDEAEEANRRLLADLDALAGRTLPARLERVIAGSAERQLNVLADLMVGPLVDELGDRELTVVPTRGLASVPWGLLPPCRGRPVVVSASASAWREARDRAVAPDAATRGAPALLVAAPGVSQGTDEIRAIADCHSGAAVLLEPDATVSATLKGLSGASVAHLAAHGHHEPENPMFSRLDLADGPLMAYDILDLPEPARHVVLSACDVGRTTVRPGDELLGFTAALLRSGTANVISSVSRVEHDAAVAAMTAYHRKLNAGVPPARALAEATGEVPFAPFVCFGSG